MSPNTCYLCPRSIHREAEGRVRDARLHERCYGAAPHIMSVPSPCLAGAQYRELHPMALQVHCQLGSRYARRCALCCHERQLSLTLDRPEALALPCYSEQTMTCEVKDISTL